MHRLLGLDARQIHAVRSWAQRGSIPAEYWAALAEAGVCTLNELAADAARRRAAVA